MKKFLLFCSLLSVVVNSLAQNYKAIMGSPYAGALGVHNNPASIVGTPYKWDLALFGVQGTTSTNAIKVLDYSYLSSPANSLFYIQKGEFARKANLSANVNLLNLRLNLNQKSAIAIGVNLRGYTNLKTSSYNFIDTLKNVSNFLNINPGLNNVNAMLRSSTWAEAFISYARTISDNESGRLNAGFTLRVGRGLSGAVADINDISYSRTTVNNKPLYTVNTVDVLYGYSSNYDRIKSGNGGSQNTKDFLQATNGGAAFDLGIEYLVKAQGEAGFNDNANYYDYDWKIGVSLLDVGANQYTYGLESRRTVGLKTNITNQTLDQRFDSTIRSVRTFTDSLDQLVNANYPGRQFTVVNPTRLVINVDHYLTGDFYINGELSLNIPLASLKKGWLQVKETNLLSLTPRWERKRWGAYLPIQFNTRQQFWVGAAFKAGPLLFGIHNVANLFSKSSTANGGGYIALIIRPWGGGSESRGDKRLECPKPVW